MAVRRRAIIEAGDETLDLLGLVQLVHSSQTRAIASALKFLYSDTADASAISLPKCLERLDHIILTSKMDALMENNKIDGFLARPRILEIGMAINRLVSQDLHLRRLTLLTFIMTAHRITKVLALNIRAILDGQ